MRHRWPIDWAGGGANIFPRTPQKRLSEASVTSAESVSPLSSEMPAAAAPIGGAR